MGTSYRVISEIRTDGDWVDIPDAASNVTVEPVSAAGGQVRVTYLKPVSEVSVETDGGTEPRPYVD